ncbi:unnamed protein product, partial [Ectocarpus sp. 12 AP-2014]
STYRVRFLGGLALDSGIFVVAAVYEKHSFLHGRSGQVFYRTHQNTSQKASGGTRDGRPEPRTESAELVTNIHHPQKVALLNSKGSSTQQHINSRTSSLLDPSGNHVRTGEAHRV